MILALIMVWPFVHRGLVVSAGVNPWKLFGFGMYCTPYTVKVQLGSASGNRIRPIPVENVPPRHREALRFFEQRRASLGTLYSHEELARYLAKDLPPAERFFILIEVTTLDPATASLKTGVEMYPVRTTQPPG